MCADLSLKLAIGADRAINATSTRSTPPRVSCRGDRVGALGRAPAFYIPDSRTLVSDEEDNLRRLIRPDTPTLPNFARRAEWKGVERDLVAVVLDDHDGRLTRATRKTIDTA
ncbi:MAG: hypothetical protein ACXU71_02955, partial [Croceibacterium sp.]